MNQKNKIITVYGLWFADLLSIVLSFVLATYIRFHNFKDMEDKGIHFQVCLLLLLVCTIYTFFLDWNRDFVKRKTVREFAAVVQYEIIMFLGVQPIMYVLKWSDKFSRWVMIIFPIVNVFMTLLIHLVIKKAVKLHYRSESTRIKVLVITQKSLLAEVMEKLKKELDVSYQIVDAVCMEDLKPNFLEEATLMALDEVFIYAPDMLQKQVQEIIGSFDEMGVNCHFCVELPGADSNRTKIDSFGNYPVITYTRFRSSYKRLLIKRVMDIVGGLVGLLITAVFFPFVAVAIKLDSPGPVLFSQIRIGRNGRRFKIYKFRSMYIDAEERKKELQSRNEVKGLMFKMENDPRITRVGKFIRKTSIDELPQFYNVVKGDMSLVGTRPPTEDEFEKYNQYYRRRISMTPGLTGMWQVSGRSEIENFDDVVKYDLQYIDNWSLWLDIKILFKTIWVVFAGKGSK